MEYPIKSLLIENDEDEQDIFCTALHEVDPDILCFFAKSGQEAMEKLNSDWSFLPSFIFIDMNMPLMDGRQCVREIRQMDRLNQVPVYVYSSAADPRLIAEVKQSGATDFMLKPASFQAITELLSQILKSHKAAP